MSMSQSIGSDLTDETTACSPFFFSASSTSTTPASLSQVAHCSPPFVCVCMVGIKKGNRKGTFFVG